MGGNMKQKLRLSVIGAVLFCSAIAYAQTTYPNAAYNLEGKTNFGKVGLMGGATVGNPGYIELKGAAYDSSNTDANTIYYLWVDITGDLCIASYASISTYASFPNGSWATGMDTCKKVGGQS